MEERERGGWLIGGWYCIYSLLLMKMVDMVSKHPLLLLKLHAGAALGGSLV